MTDIPVVLREFIRPDEDDDTSMRLPARDGRHIGMLTIPEIQFTAWKTFFPTDMVKGPQSRYRQSRRVIFAIDDLPADAPTSINTDEASVFFSGFPSPIPAGEWISNPPAELPVVSYADITRLIGTPAPKPASRPDDETTPKAEKENNTQKEEEWTGIPQPLVKRMQWLCWRKEERNGKTTKIPIDPITNRPTSAPNAAWSLDVCMSAVKKFHLAGVGISLKDGLIGIDYDHVLDGQRQLKPEYAGLIDEIRALNSYTEVSPSGEGLHVYAVCDVPADCQDGKHTERGEIYCQGRFFVVTGDAWAESAVDNVNSITPEMYRRVYNRIAGTQDAGKALISPPAPRMPAPTPAPTAPVRTDDEVIFLINKTAKGARLWSGDTSGYPSQSNADDALMIILADITGQNRAQMMRVFLASGLGKRAKVTERKDYIPRTIEHACKVVAEQKQKTPPAMVYEDEDDDEPDEPEDTYDYEAEDAVIKSLMDRAPAPLKAAYDYYIATSPIYQPLFALESSIIAAGVVLSRNWVTDELRFADYPIPPNAFNDYTIILAPTGHGKDAIKHFLEDVIDNDDIPIRSGASGRTAIYKLLQMYPRSVVLQDEAGKNVASSGRDPSGIKQGAETYAMEIYGSVGKLMSSEFADNKDSPLLRPIRRHGLIFLRTSTPETFCDAITYASVRDGWMPRHRVIVSYRPRPASTGAYTPDAITDPKRMLSAWRTWRDAHIGMPEVDAHRQAISPITACVWGYQAPEGVQKNAEDMRNRTTKYEIGTRDPDTKEPVVMDEPIAIRWTPEAAAKISDIYAANEAIPADNYTAMRHRKIAHIIKIAGIIAVLRDGIEYRDMIVIHQRYAQSDEGREILAAEAAAKKAYIDARNEQKTAEKSPAKDRDKRIQEAREALNKAYAERSRAVENAEKKVRQPIRKEATAKLLGTRGDTQDKITPESERAPIGKISAADVEWAADYINLLEIGAKKLIEEKITDLGYGPALDVMEDYIRSHGGKVGEARLIQACAPIRVIDEKHGLPQFLEYCEKTGRVVPTSTNRGRRWCIAEEPPKSPAKGTGTPQKPEHSPEPRQGDAPAEVPTPHHTRGKE